MALWPLMSLPASSLTSFVLLSGPTAPASPHHDGSAVSDTSESSHEL
jgi:hypothetical protein